MPRTQGSVLGFKLLRLRKDGSLGPLFINCRQRIKPGVWYKAEDHPTPGYKHRPGWHCCVSPHAPHLTEKGRVWYAAELRGVSVEKRPPSQGGTWYLAEEMKVAAKVTNERSR